MSEPRIQGHTAGGNDPSRRSVARADSLLEGDLAIDTFRFRSLRVGRGTLYVAPDFEEAVRSLGLPEPEALERMLADGAVGGQGRATTRVIELPGRSERLHLRPLCHGGALARVTRRSFLGLGRPLAELAVSAELLARGAPVSRSVLVLGRRAGLFWQASVGSVYEEGTLDAAAFLAAGPTAARTLQAARAAGIALRRFHDAGGRHADLQAANLLVRENESSTEVLVVDLDRSVLSAAVPPARRMQELMRLYRSLLKRELLEAVGDRGCAAFLGSYTKGDRALRRALRAHLPRERLRVALHALRY
ncbi:MAG: hypothetical protein JRG96_06155 [Deltaproteobacteria bacterium]|nr:hypothetical protein [Deltaproteobacteria bacterium]MBW2417259.1 hypothetical protein [Deltaproteobacteria bacterium]